MVRGVFDTNVLYSAALKPAGGPAQLLNLVTVGILTPCISDEVMSEYLDVLAPPILRPNAAEAPEVSALMVKFAMHVSPSKRFALCSDPDDNRFLEYASEAGAAFLVTGNLCHFPKDFDPVAIVTPRELLQRLIDDQR